MYLKESSWSRIIQHIENTKTFAVISGFITHEGASQEEARAKNIRRTKELQQKIKDMKLGYIPQEGGYTYTNPETGTDEPYKELPFFIPNISLEKAMQLGSEMGQESILFKSPDSFRLIYTKDGKDYQGRPFKKGQVGEVFRTRRKPDGQTTFDPKTLRQAYSALRKGTKIQVGKKYAYVKECVSLKEYLIPSLADAYIAAREGRPNFMRVNEILREAKRRMT